MTSGTWKVRASQSKAVDPRLYAENRVAPGPQVADKKDQEQGMLPRLSEKNARSGRVQPIQPRCPFRAPTQQNEGEPYAKNQEPVRDIRHL